MKSEEAFNLIAQVVSQCKFTLQEGESIKQALQLLIGLVQADNKSEPAKESKVK